jgi:hypothetical protein
MMLCDTWGDMSVWKDILVQFEAHLEQSDLAETTVAGHVCDVRDFAVWLADHAGHQMSPGDFPSRDVGRYKRHLRHVQGRSFAYEHQPVHAELT